MKTIGGQPRGCKESFEIGFIGGGDLRCVADIIPT